MSPVFSGVRVRAQSSVTLAVVVTAVIVIAVGGTSSAKPSLSPLQLIRNAAKTTSTAPSETLSFTEVISAAGHRLTLRFDGRESCATNEGEGSVVSFTGARQHYLVFGRTLYAQVPTSARSLNAGKPWVAVDVPVSVAQKQLASSSGSSYLMLLSGAHGSVTDLGPSTVGSTPTTEYKVNVDLSGLLGQAVSTTVPGFSTALKSLGIKNLPVEVWLDSTGRPRQMKVAIDADGATATVTGRITPSDQPVSLTRPAAAETNVVSTLAEWAALSAGGLAAASTGSGTSATESLSFPNCQDVRLTRERSAS